MEAGDIGRPGVATLTLTVVAVCACTANSRAASLTRKLQVISSHRLSLIDSISAGGLRLNFEMVTAGAHPLRQPRAPAAPLLGRSAAGSSQGCCTSTGVLLLGETPAVIRQPQVSISCALHCCAARLH